MPDKLIGPWGLDKVLTLWPVFIVFSIAGWGVAFQTVTKARLIEREEKDLFVCAFIGMVVVTLLAMTINLEFPLGVNPGIWFVGIGVIPFIYMLFRETLWRFQALILFLATVFISILLRHTGFSYDAGLYHIPYMTWMANEAVPLGLANLEGRLGFNSAWLAFCSAYSHSIRYPDIIIVPHIEFLEDGRTRSHVPHDAGETLMPNEDD
ncbi:MAG: hypothetical protein IT487_07230, partial [Chromatiaceae bacterium]|nr:hypothetical protein [Chromatiaceae bacterium]